MSAVTADRHAGSAGELLSGQALLREGFAVRREVCVMLEKHRGEIEPFIPGDFRAYVSYMASDGVWGGKHSQNVTD